MPGCSYFLDSGVIRALEAPLDPEGSTEESAGRSTAAMDISSVDLWLLPMTLRVILKACCSRSGTRQLSEYGTASRFGYLIRNF